MRFHGFVKGVDDFGREAIDSTHAKYTLIAEHPEIGDPVLFIYPDRESTLFYIASKDYPCPWNDNNPDDFPIFEGELTIYPKRDQFSPLHQWVEDNKHKYPSITKEICDFVKKTVLDKFKNPQKYYPN